MPTIVDQPETRADAERGETVAFAVEYAGAAEPAVTWYEQRFAAEDVPLRSGDGVTVTADETGSRLAVETTGDTAAAMYYCVVADAATGESATSDAAALRFGSPDRDLRVESEPFEGSFPLVTPEGATPVVVDDDDAAVVHTAADAFAGDLERLSGTEPSVVAAVPDGADKVVVVGSVGESPLVRRLVERDAFESFHVRHGQWETFVVTAVEAPVEGVDRALVVAGSDPRGAAFGLFELSAAAGVSPWTWWADVPVPETEAVHVSPGPHEFGPPSVTYRGVFINDEQWGLRPWAAGTHEPGSGNIGPRTYERVFELLLRLRANHVWPAMHPGTAPFYADPENQAVADEYGVVVGTSHTEVMLFNNEEEWDTDVDGPWDYTRNAERMREVWDERVAATADSETVYQVGIRGQHDTEMEGVDSDAEAAALLERVIEDQREIIDRHHDADVTDVPQVFTPYKEVLDYYEAGLDVPGDVTLLWVDDNYGYVRRFSDADERARPGGGGLYYHLSYLGLPHPYLWCDSTPPARTWREVTRAHRQGMAENWVVNVGDIKRREWGTECFLDLAWDVDAWVGSDTRASLERVAARDLGPEHAEAVADLLCEYYRLAAERRPTFMGFSFHWFGEDAPEDPAFSPWNYGDEVARRAEQVRDLRERAAALSEEIDPDRRDAFFELVYFPVATAANLNLKQLYAYRSRVYAAQGRADANRYADLALAEFDRFLENVRTYNEGVADGKWQGIVDPKPGMGGGAEIFDDPDVDRVALPDAGGIGVAIEGSSTPLGGADGPVPAERVTLAASDATVEGAMTLADDDDGTYLVVPERTDGAAGPDDAAAGTDEKTGGSDDGSPSPANAATFEFTVETGGRYELAAVFEHHDEALWEWDSHPWYVAVDDQRREFNDDVGVGRFRVGEFDLDPGRHTVRFATDERGSTLRSVRLRGQRTNILPPLDRRTRRERFVDVFARGEASREWTAEPSEPWIRLSQRAGEVDETGDRLWVGVDDDALPDAADPTGHVDIADGDRSVRVYVAVADGPAASAGAHVEDDGVVSIRAEHYRDSHPGELAEWTAVDGLGPTGTAMVPEPLTGWYVADLDQVADRCPALEYEVVVTEGGEARLRVDAVASFAVDHGRDLRTAVSVDGGDLRWVTFRMGPAESRAWKYTVAENAMSGTATLDLDPGTHTLRVWASDPSVNVTGLVLDFGGLRSSYLAPPETRVEES